MTTPSPPTAVAQAPAPVRRAPTLPHRPLPALALAVAAGLACAAAGAVTGAAGPGRPGSDWPTFLGPDGDGTSAETGIRTDWSQGLQLVWQIEAGEGYSAPSVAAGRLFFFDRVGDEARLTAHDALTGTVLWRRTYPSTYEDYYGYSGGPRASPVVDGDRVYVYGVDGRLRCHRVTTGELIWEVDTLSRFDVVQNFFGVGSTPLVEGDLLLVMVGGSPPGSPPIHSGKVMGNGTGIVAFDKRSGAVRWSVSDELASYSSLKAVTINGRRWGFAFARGGLLGFDPVGGTERFRFPWRAAILESVNAATPLVVDDLVFVSETYGPGSLLLRIGGDTTPEVVWKDPSGRGQSLRLHWSTPIYVDGHLYASSGRNSGDAELRCVRLADGAVRWSQKGLHRSTLLGVDGKLVVLTEYGKLLLVEPTPETYRPLGELDLRGETGSALLEHPAWNAPILAHGILYVRGKNRLLALELIPPAP